MHGLKEYDTVAVALPEDGLVRDATVECRVIAMAGSTVALEPLQPAKLTWLPERVAGAFMIFRVERSLVAFKGVLLQSGAVGDLRFKLSDRAQMPRLKASSTQICLPIGLRPGTASDEETQGMTVQLSADELLVECPLEASVGDSVDVALSLPGIDDPVETQGAVTRVRQGLLTLDLSGGDRSARQRLARFVVERNRATLRRERLRGEDLDF